MGEYELLVWVKEVLIYKRLRLKDLGITLSEISYDTPLFDEDGLSLDSIDGLELAVGIEQEFGVKIDRLTEMVAREKFATVRTISQYILSLKEGIG